MNQINLGYGQDSVTFGFDEDRFQVLTSSAPPGEPLTDVEIGEALDSPIESLPLDELLRPGESVLIVVSDATRATASAQIVSLLVRRLIQYGISAGDIAIIFSTGIHRRVTTEEKRELLTPFIFKRIRTIDHDAYDLTQLVDVGKTKRGAPVELNRALQEYSHVILTGAIGFHYFAGFTGGRKSICPGLASAQTIELTHMLALDFENGGRQAGVGIGLLDGNAVNEECEQIAGMTRLSFGVYSIVDGRGRVVRIFAGHWLDSHRAGCRQYLADHSISIEGKREVVVVSCGGAPYDVNLIQAHKALEMASHACEHGGTIILLAECGDGLGRADFLKWFEEADSGALESRLRGKYEVNGQTAWSLLSKTEHYRVFLISALAEKDVCRMRFIPMGSLDQALAELNPAAKGYILPRGAAFLPVTTH